MKKVQIIHLHPSLSFIGRCLSLVNKDSKLVIIHGASIHNKYNLKFITWIKQNIVKKKINKSLLFQIYKIKPFNFFNIFYEMLFYRISKTNKIYQKDIVLDSICRRKKSSYLYYRFSFLRNFIKYIFRVYCKFLICYYKNILDRVKPNNIFISHPVYIEYGSLIIAATEKKIPITVISGAFHNSYIINGKFKTYHFAMFIKYLYKKYKTKNDHRISAEAKNSLINDPKLSLLRCNSSQYSNTLIITTHCFSDNNHISKTEKMIYPTYFEWFIETCKILNKIEVPKYKYYIIKIHPYIKVYKEENLIYGIIKKYLKNKKINLKICYPHQYISDVINEKYIYPINLTVHGQVCSELGSVGIPSIACGLAQGPLEAQYNPTDALDYKKIILDNIYASECLNKLKDSKKIIKECKEYIKFSKILLPDDSLKNKLYEIRNFYNFQEEKLISSKALEILIDLKKKKLPKKLMLNKGWGVYIPNGI